ncbi:MBL fold metallo-hydrolase [Natronorubrum tibetense]|uniref:Beta-lactamase n=1 Tax=Natronorubrum tibetense GA33 TaxID=1114856 RepID=L9VKU7_9EURY|nr:MBL fold metallo-hydrolase [Natronorubrum tibetense]ELY37825.1 beta-lactamase [Natronorubrum tibetense GA33]
MDELEQISIPTPFSVGRVNCYLLPGDELTLLDPGPSTPDAYEALESGLTQAGYRIDDVDQILISHPHMDHFGQVRRIQSESNARVLAHEDAVARLADPLEHFSHEQAFFRPFLMSMGVPEQIVDTVVGLPEAYTEFQEPVDVDRELKDGDDVAAGIDLTAVHTPGHSPGSVCYVAPAADVAFTGDHVLADVTPNPLLTLDPTADTNRTRSLPLYLDSLRKLLEVDVTVGYGGHSEPMPDLSGRIRETIEHHQARKERIAAMLAEQEPATAYDLMQEMFPDLPATEMFPGMSEVIGHLDLLEDEDRVKISDVDGVQRYASA